MYGYKFSKAPHILFQLCRLKYKYIQIQIVTLLIKHTNKNDVQVAEQVFNAILHYWRLTVGVDFEMQSMILKYQFYKQL